MAVQVDCIRESTFLKMITVTWQSISPTNDITLVAIHHFQESLFNRMNATKNIKLNRGLSKKKC